MKMLTKLLIVSFFLCSYNLFAQDMKIEYKTIKENDEKNEINVTYPQVNFGPDALMGIRGVAADLNASIDSMVTAQIESFKYEIRGGKLINEQKNSYKSEAEVVYNNNGLLSVLFSNYVFISGAAHPYTTLTTFNYSINTDGKLMLSDLFIKDSGWLQFISDYAANELTKMAQKDGVEANLQGVSASESNFTAFNIKDDVLWLNFNQGQVGPEVWGTQRVSILLGDMANLLDHEGPLGYLYKK